MAPVGKQQKRRWENDRRTDRRTANRGNWPRWETDTRTANRGNWPRWETDRRTANRGNWPRWETDRRTANRGNWPRWETDRRTANPTGPGGIRTHAPCEIGALIQRLRPTRPRNLEHETSPAKRKVCRMQKKPVTGRGHPVPGKTLCEATRNR